MSCTPLSAAFLLFLLLSTAHAAARATAAASPSSDGDEAAAASVGGRSAECFRGAQIGVAYHYDFATEFFFEKSHLNEEQVRRSHRRTLNVELAARLTPVAEDEQSGALHVRLEIESAHLKDLEGWQAYDADGDASAVDPTAADAQLVEALQRDFYYTQHCNMEISDVHYPDDEAQFAVNLKNQLVSSFSHRLLWQVDASGEAAAQTYTQHERDHLGVKRVVYEHVSAAEMRRRRKRNDVPDDVLTVVARHDEPRAVAMSVKGMDGASASASASASAASTDGAPPTHLVDLDQLVHKETQFRAGVVVGIELEQHHEFPGKNTADEMAAAAAAADNVQYDTSRDAHRPHTDARGEHDARYAASSNGFQMRSGGRTRVTLRAQRKRAIAPAEPTRVASFAAFAAIRHGDTLRFVSRSPHFMLVDRDVHERVRSASDDPSRTVATLASLTVDDEEGHFAWRSLLNRLTGADHDAVLGELRALLGCADALDDGGDVAVLPEAARQHLMSLLGELGSEDTCALLLDIAVKADDNSRDR